MCIWAYASGRPLGDRPGLTDNEQQMRQMINMIFPKWVDRVGEPSVFDTLCFLMNCVKALDLDHLQVEMGFDMPRVLCSLMIVAFRHAQTLAFGDRQARVRLRRYDCFGGRSVLVFVLECVFFKNVFPNCCWFARCALPKATTPHGRTSFAMAGRWPT